jgi:hypothetical protein
MMDHPLQNKIDAAIEELSAMVEGDGIVFHVLEVDLPGSRITLRVDLDEASCSDCVLPPAALAGVVEHVLGQSVQGLQVILDDPRLEPTSMEGPK